MNHSNYNRSLKFHLGSLSLLDSAGASVSLVAQPGIIPHKGFFANLYLESMSQLHPSSYSEIEIGDLPCRLDGRSLQDFMHTLWNLAKSEATIKIQIPHPRHDAFLQDFGYIRALLPEAFINHQWSHFFEVAERSYLLDPYWQAALDRKEVTLEDIEMISRQANNVIEKIEIVLRVKKEVQEFKPVQLTKPISAEMRCQLEDQRQVHIQRGNHEAAAVIEQFLAAQIVTEPNP